MKILNLKIKQRYLTAMLEGRKVQEIREIRPNNEKKYIQLDAQGFAIEDANGNSVPLHYDAIMFVTHFGEDADFALIEVKAAHTEILVDNNDKVISYDYKGQDYLAERVVYDLGKILEYNIREQSRKI